MKRSNTDKMFARNMLAASIVVALGGYSAMSAAADEVATKTPTAVAEYSFTTAKKGGADLTTTEEKFESKDTNNVQNKSFEFFPGSQLKLNLLDKAVRPDLLISSEGLQNQSTEPGVKALSSAEMTFTDATLKGDTLVNNACLKNPGAGGACGNHFDLSLKDSSLDGNLLLNVSKTQVLFVPDGDVAGSVGLDVTLDNSTLTGAAGREDVKFMTEGDATSGKGDLSTDNANIKLTLKNNSTWNVKNHDQTGYNFEKKADFSTAEQKFNVLMSPNDEEKKKAVAKFTELFETTPKGEEFDLSKITDETLKNNVQEIVDAYKKPLQLLKDKTVVFKDSGSQLTGLSFDGTGNTVNIKGSSLDVMGDGITAAAASSGQFNVSDKGSLKGDVKLEHADSRIGINLTSGGKWDGSVTSDIKQVVVEEEKAAEVAAVARNVGRAAARATGATSTATAGGLFVNVSGDGSAWTGNADAKNGGNVVVTLADKGQWNGKATRDTDSKLDVSVDSGAKWTSTAESSVSSLTVSRDAAVDSSAGKITADTLTLQNGADINNFTGGENLVVSRFTAPVTLGSQGAEADVNTAGLYQKAGKTFVLASVSNPGSAGIGGVTELGAWQYDTTAVKSATEGTYDVVLAKSNRISNAAATALSLAAAPVSISGLLSDTLDSHLDASRRNAGDKGGVWISYFGGKNKVNTSAGADFDMDTNGVMLGADSRFDVDGGAWLAGVAASSSRSDLNVMRSNGDTDAYGVQAYLSRRYDSGIFVDTTAQFAHYSSSANAVANDGKRGDADFSTNGFGAGVKLGYDWRDASGFFAEPYAKLSAKTFDSVAYTLSNDMKVNSDSVTSVQGELGATAGYRFTTAHGYVEPYVHLAGINEFSDGNNVRLNDTVSLNNSTDGSAVRVGAGARVKFMDNVGGYAGLDYTKGSDTEQPLQGMIGVNVTW